MDAQVAIQVTKEAIARGERGLSTRRSQDALAAARRVAARVGDFTTDDVWMELGWKCVDHDSASFMGSVMRHLSVSGEIRKTGLLRKSIRPEQHRKEIRVWTATEKAED